MPRITTLRYAQNDGGWACSFSFLSKRVPHRRPPEQDWHTASRRLVAGSSAGVRARVRPGRRSRQEAQLLECRTARQEVETGASRSRTSLAKDGKHNQAESPQSTGMYLRRPLNSPPPDGDGSKPTIQKHVITSPVVTLAGPRAMTGYEPRQARKGATVVADACAAVWLARATTQNARAARQKTRAARQKVAAEFTTGTGSNIPGFAPTRPRAQSRRIDRSGNRQE